jgi:hypothetical protein
MMRRTKAKVLYVWQGTEGINKARGGAATDNVIVKDDAAHYHPFVSRKQHDHSPPTFACLSVREKFRAHFGLRFGGHPDSTVKEKLSAATYLCLHHDAKCLLSHFEFAKSEQDLFTMMAD